MSNLEYEQSLKASIRTHEGIYIGTCKMLENVFKSPAGFPPADELVIWYKNDLREQKNSSKLLVDKLRKELTDCREGLNPVFYYPQKQNG